MNMVVGAPYLILILEQPHQYLVKAPVGPKQFTPHWARDLGALESLEHLVDERRSRHECPRLMRQASLQYTIFKNASIGMDNHPVKTRR